MIEAPHYGSNGTRHPQPFALPADVFDGTVNEPVLHQAVKIYLANQRQGTHQTKTRRWVTGGNQKPWRQKGTGRARQGTTRAPHWPGGGTVFGPHPRDYRQDIPKKVRLLARRSALNARAREGALWVIDGVSFDVPKTARVAGLLEALQVAGRKVLVLTAGMNRNLYKSARNLPSVDVMPFTEAAAYDVLWADLVLVEREAFTGEARPDAAPAAEPGGAAPNTEAPAADTGSPRTASRARRPAAAPPDEAAPKAAPRARKPAAPRKKKGED